MTRSIPRAVVILAAVLFLVALAPVATAGSLAPPGQVASVDQAVIDDLAADGRADFWVALRKQADLAPAYRITDWAARGQFVYDALTRTARDTQREVVAALDKA